MKTLAIIFLLTCVVTVGAMTIDRHIDIQVCHKKGGEMVHTGGGNVTCLTFK